MGTARYGTLSVSYRYGIKDYALGSHPIWELVKTAHHITKRPVLLGALCRGAGYLLAAVRRVERHVSPELVAFHRLEQMRRLKAGVKSFLPGGSRDLRTIPASGTIPEPADCSDTAPARATWRPLTYVLITPARNEAQFIESTIKSVVAQTVRPLKWVIASDGSTDGTDEIVRKYAASHPWIELMRMPERRERHFGGKAHAVNAAYASLRNLEFQVIANLDGDISIREGYFAYLLSKLAADPALGLVGTPFQETSGETYDYRFVSIEHVSGACQVFRRQCFEDIGGYLPLTGGGVDHVALISARMKGWKTRTFVDMVCLHRRAMGTAQHGTCAAWFRTGVKDYRLGGHPLWELFRIVYRMARRPVIVGGLVLGAGYFWAMVRRVERPLSRELEAFHRQDQLRRLKKFFTRKSVLAAERLQRPA